MALPLSLLRWHPCALALALACRGLGQVVETPGAWDGISLHAQSTALIEGYPSFSAAYTGTYSLPSRGQTSQTVVSSITLGLRVGRSGALYADPEVDAGHVLNNSLGLAGFPNGELARSDSGTPVWGLPRLYYQQVVDLGGDAVALADGPNQVALTTRAERLVVTIGEFGAYDSFDSNAYAHDPQGQFMNWALMDDPAWDFPDATYGWTDGVSVEWRTPQTVLRWGVFMEPKEAGGLSLDHRIQSTHGQALEWEKPYELGGRSGTLRTLVFWNRARMGVYQQALLSPSDGLLPSRALRSKAGMSFSWDQAIGSAWGIFARAGANDGRSETWGFTEADQSLSAGVSAGGLPWRRPNDTLAFALAADFLSPSHRRYLAAGGLGMVLGDGALAYRPEEVAELYYAFQAGQAVTVSPDLQVIENPGYNHARGPVIVWTLRVHLAR